MIEKKYCVYRHVRLDTNKTFYVGVGNKKRPYTKSGRSSDWGDVINTTKYVVEVLAKDLPLFDAYELEVFLIKLYGRADKGLGPLVNLTDGGGGTDNVTQAVRDNMSTIAKNRIFSKATREILSANMKIRNIGNTHNLGKKGSKEKSEKLSKLHKGISKSEEHKKKLSDFRTGKKFDRFLVLDTATGVYYYSIREASEYCGVNHLLLCRYLSGDRKNKTSLIRV